MQAQIIEYSTLKKPVCQFQVVMSQFSKVFFFFSANAPQRVPSGFHKWRNKPFRISVKNKGGENFYCNLPLAGDASNEKFVIWMSISSFNLRYDSFVQLIASSFTWHRARDKIINSLLLSCFVCEWCFSPLVDLHLNNNSPSIILYSRLEYKRRCDDAFQHVKFSTWLYFLASKPSCRLKQTSSSIIKQTEQFKKYIKDINIKLIIIN